MLLQRLSVFAGGWTLEAAETVCASAGSTKQIVCDVLLKLVDKSLVVAAQQVDETMRYRLLDTVRAYLGEVRQAHGEQEALRQRHALYFVEFAERAAPELCRSQQRAWLERLAVEHDNLRAALRATLDTGSVDLAMRLCTALWRFWATHGHFGEGRAWIDRILTSFPGASAAARAPALNAAAWLALLQADYATAMRRSEECLALRWEAGDPAGVAESLANLAEVARQHGEHTRARRLIDESLALYQAATNRVGIADTLNIAGMILYVNAETAGAANRYADSLALRRELGDIRGIASTLANMGDLARDAGDFDTAESQYAESLTLRRDLGDTRGVATVLALLGETARRRGLTERARALYQEGLELATHLGAERQMAACSDGLARLSGRPTNPRPLRADLLPATAHPASKDSVAQSQTVHGYARPPVSLSKLSALRYPQSGALGRGQHERGSIDETEPGPLTRREREVSALIAQGLSNREIAEKLVVSERTVHSHVRTILNKLALTSRTQIATWTVLASATEDSSRPGLASSSS
jgi:non-specific serine/threonine protein kinase